MSFIFFRKIKNILAAGVSLIIKNFFIFSFVLLIIVFILAGLIFYEYAYKTPNHFDTQDGDELKVNSALYQKVFSKFEEKQKAFKESPDIQDVPDPFIQ
jgi:predicted negative regulator of RcsB-dependent stress response